MMTHGATIPAMIRVLMMTAVAGTHMVMSWSGVLFTARDRHTAVGAALARAHSRLVCRSVSLSYSLSRSMCL